MLTRCPDCHTVHPVNAGLLAAADGMLRCGKCDKRFNGLEALYDHWPEAADKPATHGARTRKAPTLGMDIRPQPTDEPEAQGLAVEERAGGRKARIAWALAAVAMSALLLVNLGWTFRDQWLQIPEVRAIAERAGWVESDRAATFRDPSLIRLVSRDMHVHPTRAGVLVLNATLTNTASRSQAFPQLEVTLLDAANRALARRTFEPAEYLEPGSDPTTAFAPGVYLPVLLELVDPGEQAVGFQLEFL